LTSYLATALVVLRRDRAKAFGGKNLDDNGDVAGKDDAEWYEVSQHSVDPVPCIYVLLVYLISVLVLLFFRVFVLDVYLFLFFFLCFFLFSFLFWFLSLFFLFLAAVGK